MLAVLCPWKQLGWRGRAALNGRALRMIISDDRTRIVVQHPSDWVVYTYDIRGVTLEDIKKEADSIAAKLGWYLL